MKCYFNKLPFAVAVPSCSCLHQHVPVADLSYPEMDEFEKRVRSFVLDVLIDESPQSPSEKRHGANFLMTLSPAEKAQLGPYLLKRLDQGELFFMLS